MDSEGPVGLSKRSIPLFHKACVADLEIDELSVCHDPVHVSVQTDESGEDTTSLGRFPAIINQPSIPTSRLFVKNLPVDIQYEEIERLFQQYGSVQSIKLLHVSKHVPSELDRSLRSGRSTTIQAKEDDMGGESPPNVEWGDSNPYTFPSTKETNPFQPNDPGSTMTYAYCSLESIEAAKRAYEELNRTYCFGHCQRPIDMVYVRTYTPRLEEGETSLLRKSNRDGKEESSDEEGDSSRDSSEDSRNDSSPVEGSYAREDAGRAHASWDTQGISSSHALFMDPSKPLAFQDDLLDTRRKLFVGQLPKEVDEFTLVDLFCEFGILADIKVLRARGVSRGCGFVRFTEPEEASAAVEELCGSKVFQRDKELPLNVRFADNIHEKIVRRHMKAEDKAKKLFGSAVVSPELLSKVSSPYMPAGPFLSAEPSFSDHTTMSNASAAAYAASMPMLRRTVSMGITASSPGAASGAPYALMSFAPQTYPGMGVGGIPGLNLGKGSNCESPTTNIAGVRSSHAAESSQEQQQPTQKTDGSSQSQAMDSQGQAGIAAHSFSSAISEQTTSQPLYSQGAPTPGYPQGVSPNTSMPLPFMGPAAASYAYQAANAGQYPSPMHNPMYGYPQHSMAPIVHAGEAGSHGSNHFQHRVTAAENRTGSQMNMMPGASSAATATRHSGYRFIPVCVQGAVYYFPVPMGCEPSSGINEYAQYAPRPEVSRSASAPNAQKPETSGSPLKTPVKSGVGQHSNVAMSPVTPITMPPATRYDHGPGGGSIPGFAAGYPGTNPSGMPYPAGLVSNASGTPYPYPVPGIAFDHSGNGRGSFPGAANFSSFIPALPHSASQPHYRYSAYGPAGGAGSNAAGMMLPGMNPMYYAGFAAQMQNHERFGRFARAGRRQSGSLGSGEGSHGEEAANANAAADAQSKLEDKGVPRCSSCENQSGDADVLTHGRPTLAVSEDGNMTVASCQDLSGATAPAAVHVSSAGKADSVVFAGEGL